MTENTTICETHNRYQPCVDCAEAKSNKSWTLTPIGNFVMRHSVRTPPGFWKQLIREVEDAADAGSEWEMILQERIAGMQEYLRRRGAEGGPEHWMHHGTPT